MTDVVSQGVRSRMMSSIRGKDTKPEMAVRRALFAAGFRFRLHRKDLPGIPDVVLAGRRVAVFVHGCFWHRHIGCQYAKLPATRPEFWKEKLEKNVRRDERVVESLQSCGWRVLIVWECAVRDKETAANLAETLSEWIRGNGSFGEVSGSTGKKEIPVSLL